MPATPEHAGIALLAAVVCALAAPAAAQDVTDVVSDVGAFRRALGSPIHANVSCDDGSLHAAIRADADGLRWNGGSWALSDVTLPWTSRVAALALSTADVESSASALGVPLVEQWLSFEVLDGDDGPVFVRRLGSARFNVAVEPGIARPREWRVTLDGVRYTARVTATLDVAYGWYPAMVVLLQDDDVVGRCEITDAAPSSGALAPLAAPTIAVPTSIPSMPRLPL